MNATIYVGQDDLWERFQAVCKAQGVSASEALRVQMTNYIKRAEKRAYPQPPSRRPA